MNSGSRIVRDVAFAAPILGGVGFLCGFFGPIVLAPEANQGPLLGIFITGPGGALLGLVVGATTGALRLSPAGFRTALVCSGTLLAATTLFFSTPEPQYRAGILDAEIVGCAATSTRREKALAYWEEALVRTSYAPAREGWKEDFDHMLAHESAVVLQLQVLHQSGVYENRTPWNRGSLKARPQRTRSGEQTYFATYAGGSCESYPTGTRSRFLATGQTSQQWPPEILANLLNLQTVEPAPERYLSLVGE